jgi:hypothetical protein
MEMLEPELGLPRPALTAFPVPVSVPSAVTLLRDAEPYWSEVVSASFCSRFATH